MQSAIVFRWSGPRTGREVEALKAADMADAMFDGLVAQGLATSGEWITSQTGGDPDMGILRGDAANLMGMMASPEFRDFANAYVYALADGAVSDGVVDVLVAKTEQRQDAVSTAYREYSGDRGRRDATCLPPPERGECRPMRHKHADLALIGDNVDEAYPGWRAMVEGVTT